MNKEQIINLYNKANEYFELDNKMDDSLKSFSNVWFPESHPPIRDIGYLTSFLSCLDLINKQIADLFSYHFYESKNMKDGGFYEIDGVQYKTNTIEELLILIEKLGILTD